MAMIATTTISSINVKPRGDGVEFLRDLFK